MTIISTKNRPGPIEVWLRQRNMTVTCHVVHEDESEHEYDVRSLSMRGAQREITAWLIREGYAPVGRWSAEAVDGDDVVESSRKFRVATAPPGGDRLAEDLARQNAIPRVS